MLRVGSPARIKQEAWERFFKEEGLDTGRINPSPQIVFALLAHTLFHDWVMLEYPFFWWHEDDVEPV